MSHFSKKRYINICFDYRPSPCIEHFSVHTWL